MILVSLPHDGGTAVVYRDAKGTWMGAGPGGATLLDTRPARMGIGGGRMLVGGVLPPGASRAIVEGKDAATGNGAWIAIIDSLGVGYELAARYETPDGTILRHPSPAGWTREAVSDA